MAVPHKTRDAEGTRARILEAARVRFSRIAYDGVGLRDIARDVGIDVALIARYFGSKEGLFREVAERAFSKHLLVSEGSLGFTRQVQDILLGIPDEEGWRERFDALRLLLSSLSSPVAGPIAAKCFARDFIHPLAELIGGDSARECSAMMTAQIVGIAVVRLILTSNDDYGDMT